MLSPQLHDSLHEALVSSSSLPAVLSKLSSLDTSNLDQLRALMQARAALDTHLLEQTITQAFPRATHRPPLAAHAQRVHQDLTTLYFNPVALVHLHDWLLESHPDDSLSLFQSLVRSLYSAAPQPLSCYLLSSLIQTLYQRSPAPSPALAAGLLPMLGPHIELTLPSLVTPETDPASVHFEVHPPASDSLFFTSPPRNTATSRRAYMDARVKRVVDMRVAKLGELGMSVWVALARQLARSPAPGVQACLATLAQSLGSDLALSRLVAGALLAPGPVARLLARCLADDAPHFEDHEAALASLRLEMQAVARSFFEAVATPSAYFPLAIELARAITLPLRPAIFPTPRALLVAERNVDAALVADDSWGLTSWLRLDLLVPPSARSISNLVRIDVLAPVPASLASPDAVPVPALAFAAPPPHLETALDAFVASRRLPDDAELVARMRAHAASRGQIFDEAKQHLRAALSLKDELSKALKQTEAARAALQAYETILTTSNASTQNYIMALKVAQRLGQPPPPAHPLAVPDAPPIAAPHCCSCSVN